MSSVMRLARKQPSGAVRNSTACDSCVGAMIERGYDDAVIAAECRNVKRYGSGLDQVMLVNVLVPGCGTQQFTLCHTCRRIEGLT